jgi:RNA 3'-terminal phosphate cyclase (ATP)
LLVLVMQAHEKRLMEVDGSYSEGGGQILRTSLALSAILEKPAAITHIREKRPNPGLRPQHLAGVKALAEIAEAEVEGAHVGSSKVSFIPRKISPGNYQFNVADERRSAGSVTLLLQTLLPPLCLSREVSRLTLRGGTHVPWSPPFHYVSDVLSPILKRMGIHIETRLERWGWYPKGGGIVQIEITPPGAFRPVTLIERGSLVKIRGLSAISGLPKHVAERQRDHASRRIEKELRIEAEIESLYDVPGEGPGSFLFLVAESEKGIAGFSSLGARGRRAEEVANGSVDAMIDYIESDGCVDPHLADQLLIFMTLSEGTSSFTTSRVTNHLITNLWAIQQWTDLKITLSGVLGEKGTVVISREERGR